jgi:hypothetical protein
MTPWTTIGVTSSREASDNVNIQAGARRSTVARLI